MTHRESVRRYIHWRREGTIISRNWNDWRLKKAMLAIASFLVCLVAGFCPGLAAGAMLVSDTNPKLAVNAFGGAADGTVLKLVNNCTPDNTDCTWSFLNGMLVSDTNPKLAVNAFGGATDGTVLKLVNNCTTNRTDCTWTYRIGMLLSPASAESVVSQTLGQVGSIYVEEGNLAVEMDTKGSCGSQFFIIRRNKDNFKELAAGAIAAFSGGNPMRFYVVSCSGDRNIVSAGAVYKK
jgi:hypothetical protein